MPWIAVFLLTFSFTCIAHEYNEEGWKKASGFLTASMDTSAHPCRNFYNYACGRWINRASREGSDELRDAETKLRTLLLQAMRKGKRPGTVQTAEAEPDYKKWLRAIYDQCMNLDVMTEKEVVLGLFRILTTTARDELHKEVRQANITNFISRLWFTAGYFERMFMSHLGIEAGVDWVLKNCTKHSILKLTYTSKASLRVSKEKLEENFKFFLTQLNFSSDDTSIQFYIRQWVKNITSLEADLVGLVNKEFELKKGAGNYEQMIRISELPVKYPAVDWDVYLMGLFGKEEATRWKRKDPEILVVGDNYFKTVSSLIGKYTFDTIQGYAYWRVVNQVKESYVSQTSQHSSVQGKDVFCYEVMKEQAPAAVARMFFDVLEADISEWRSDIDLVAHNVLSAFRIFVSGQDWLSSRDKMIVVERINNIRVDTGIPHWLSNDQEVNERTPQVQSDLGTLENIVNAHRMRFRRAFQPLLDAQYGFEEPMPTLTVGAQYSFGKIDIYLGQLLPPLYHIHYPLAVKYGMLGWLLGHELMHGFDEASLREGPNRGQTWLRGDVEKMFHQRKRCLVRQYSAFCYKGSGGKCISGVKTVNENIGDIEGLKIAYMAYKFVTQTMGSEPPVPKLVRRTNDQIFFISAAQLHCGKQYNFFVEHEEHPPNNVRVDQSMRNFPVFAKAFGCIKGSKYAPIRTCSLWGRFVSPSQCDMEDVYDKW